MFGPNTKHIVGTPTKSEDAIIINPKFREALNENIIKIIICMLKTKIEMDSISIEMEVKDSKFLPAT